MAPPESHKGFRVQHQPPRPSQTVYGYARCCWQEATSSLADLWKPTSRTPIPPNIPFTPWLYTRRPCQGERVQAACPLPPRCHRASLPGRRTPTPVLCEKGGVTNREEGTPLPDCARLGQRCEVQQPYLLMGWALQQLLFQLHFLLCYLSHFKIHLREQRNTLKRQLLSDVGVCITAQGPTPLL